MTRVLLASDAPWVEADVTGTLLAPEFDLVTVDRGEDVVAATNAFNPDVVVLDLQIGDMGAAAITSDLRNETDSGRSDTIPVLFLLDREADKWLARRVGASDWILKPLPPGALVEAVRGLAAAV